MARAGVKDKVDGSGMLRRLAKVATHACAVIPLGLRLAGLERGGKDKGGRAERVEVAGFGADSNAGEFLNG
jgi:hypothetical protein